ncbi:Nn.00g079660.m01.CDS01 [Neocucurbitaria sp. VM-36]
MTTAPSDHDAPGRSRSRGSTTEPNTPGSIDLEQHLFARLIPTNRPAREAVQQTRVRGSPFHATFLGETDYRGQATPCFQLSLGALPQFPKLGWRINRGRDNLPHRGMDLLLWGARKSDHVAGIHARLSFIRGAAGFFLVADNARGMPCTINGDDFAHDRRPIPFRSTITLGECAFTLHYVVRDPEAELRFQLELKTFYQMALADENPFILPTPREVDSRFGDWVVQYPISEGTFGTVFVVTHAADGRLAAAKQLVKTRFNAARVEQEVAMAKLVATLSHPSIASPFEIRHNPCRSQVEIARIRTLLGGDCDPEEQGDITDEYIIFAPLLNATFRSIVAAALSTSRNHVFFGKLLSGVAFLHDHGLCHRDMKPVNILIRSFHPPEVLLCDFGCVSNKAQIMYDAPGTIPYLAPEQRPGETHDPTVDYWACGLVGYELLTGEAMHTRVESRAVLKRYHAKLDEVGGLMAECCKSMLDFDPTLRMPAKDAVQVLSAARGEEDARVVKPMSQTKKMKLR